MGFGGGKGKAVAGLQMAGVLANLQPHVATGDRRADGEGVRVGVQTISAGH